MLIWLVVELCLVFTIVLGIRDFKFFLNFVSPLAFGLPCLLFLRKNLCLEAPSLATHYYTGAPLLWWKGRGSRNIQ